MPPNVRIKQSINNTVPTAIQSNTIDCTPFATIQNKFTARVVLKLKKISLKISYIYQRFAEGHQKFSVDKEDQLDVTFVFFISLLLVAQHVSGNHVPIFRS